MRYREAKNLEQDDIVFRISDGESFQVIDIEVYGQYKRVRINCLNIAMKYKISLNHEDVR